MLPSSPKFWLPSFGIPSFSSSVSHNGSQTSPEDRIPWKRTTGRGAFWIATAAQSMATHQPSLLMSMSMEITLSSSWAVPPSPGSVGNLSILIGMLNEFSFQTSFTPVKKPESGVPFRETTSRSPSAKSTSYAGIDNVTISEISPAARSLSMSPKTRGILTEKTRGPPSRKVQPVSNPGPELTTNVRSSSSGGVKGDVVCACRRCRCASG
mmetsp:Transcript_12913/g.27413  ORF Transcript_12913/g.27413 Transcript_12913/m.27413 type:complete len:210 (-) Transcript_12913:188-817(-)